MEDKLTVLGYLDYFYIGLMLIVSFAITIYHAIASKRKKRFKFLTDKEDDRSNYDTDGSDDNNTDITESAIYDINEYLTASSSMSCIPIAFSLLASFFSTTPILGTSSEVYQYGIGHLSIIFVHLFPPLIGAFFTGPFFSNLKVLSVFEYLELRFNSVVVRTFSVICYVIRSIMLNSVYILGPSITISTLTNISVTGCVIVISLIGTVCTAIGGIRGVIWTDLFQFIFMFFGMIGIIINGLFTIGGFESLWDINMKGGRLQLFDFDVNPFIRQSFWSIFFGSFTMFFLPYCIDQQMVQRFACAKTRKTAQTALLLNFPGLVIWIGLCCFTGLILYATYVDCDPLAAPAITGVRNPSQMLPFYVTDKFRSYIGVFVGTILAASLSSTSSVLNSLSAVLLQDILRRFRVLNRWNIIESSFTPKFLVLIIGLISMSIALVISKLDSNLLQISNSLVGAFSGPIIGVFLVASLFRFVNSYGAFGGMTIGLLFSIWINLGTVFYTPKYPTLPVGSSCYNFTNITNATDVFGYSKEASNLHGFNKIYSISFLYFGPISIILTLISGLLISLFTGKHKGTVRDDFLLTKWSKWYNKEEVDERDIEFDTFQ